MLNSVPHTADDGGLGAAVLYDENALGVVVPVADDAGLELDVEGQAMGFVRGARPVRVGAHALPVGSRLGRRGGRQTGTQCRCGRCQDAEQSPLAHFAIPFDSSSVRMARPGDVDPVESCNPLGVAMSFATNS